MENFKVGQVYEKEGSIFAVTHISPTTKYAEGMTNIIYSDGKTDYVWNAVVITKATLLNTYESWQEAVSGKEFINESTI